MFDQTDQNQQTQSPTISPEPTTNSSAPLVAPDPQSTSVTPSLNATPFPSDDSKPTESTTPDSAVSPSLDMSATPAAMPDPISPTVDLSTPQVSSPEPSSSPAPTLDEIEANIPASDDLMDIKKEALQNLSPLLSQLEQTPEEKFRTTMMLIQASDNQSLIQSAYSAAKEIEDEKVRAQALLDIVNEINYFTQHKNEATD